MTPFQTFQKRTSPALSVVSWYTPLHDDSVKGHYHSDFTTCSSLLSIAGINTVTKTNLGKKEFFWFMIHYHRKQRQELKAEAWRQEPEMEKDG